MKKTILVSLAFAGVLFASGIDFQTANSDPERINPGFSDDVILSFHSSIKDAKHSVVNISTTKTIKGGFHHQMDDFFNDPFFRDFFGFNFGMPQEKARKASSLGSGVIISKDGYIITNNHVIEDADEIIVTLLDDDEEYKAKLIGSDPKTDIAIIKIEAKNLSAIKFADSSKIMEGDIVFAIGNPFGVGGTITQGIISALNKNDIGLNQYENFIQTDASINPGNSGGALVDSRGALIGINSAILSRSGGNNGVGFAIPSNMVKDIAKKLIEDGKIERGYIGVNISNLTKEQKEIYKNKEGCLIVNVQKDNPAEKAGLKRGDLIIQVNENKIKNANDLKNIIGSMKPGDKAKITYERAGKIKSTSITLTQMEGISSLTGKKDTESKIDGLSVSNLTAEIKKQLRLDDSVEGILVTDVKEDSNAKNFGFVKKDVIIQVGQKEIKDIDDFNDAIKENKDKKVLVWVIRNGIPQGIVIK